MDRIEPSEQYDDELMWAGIALRHESFKPIKQRLSPVKPTATTADEDVIAGNSGSNNISVEGHSSTRS